MAGESDNVVSNAAAGGAGGGGGGNTSAVVAARSSTRLMMEGVGSRVVRGPDWKWGKQVRLFRQLLSTSNCTWVTFL